MDALITLLLIWIGNNSDYDTSKIQHPQVIEMAAEELTREAYSDAISLIPDSGIDRRVMALYSWEHSENGTIFILRSSDTEGLQAGEDPLENPGFQERLLHELVHHVQYKTGAYQTFPCKNFGEKEAYLMGGLYLMQRHAADPLPNRRVLAHMYSRC